MPPGERLEDYFKKNSKSKELHGKNYFGGFTSEFIVDSKKGKYVYLQQIF